MPNQATFRFYAELRDFLPASAATGPVTRIFDVPGSVKDMIEACGVPHTEVDLIITGSRSVDFSHLVTGGELISVFPVFRSIDVTPIVKVRPARLGVVRFVADNHLGRLARFLRLLGIDTLYEREYDDPELVRISVEEQRIVLTRDVGLLKRGSLEHGYYVRSTDPREQVVEVVRRFDLADRLTPFSRCMVCNGMLVPASKESIADRLPPRTRQDVDEYRACSSCNKIYWQGAHHQDLRRIVAAARRADRCP